jgi:hypothetical protein
MFARRACAKKRFPDAFSAVENVPVTGDCAGQAPEAPDGQPQARPLLRSQSFGRRLVVGLDRAEELVFVAAGPPTAAFVPDDVGHAGDGTPYERRAVRSVVIR